MVNSETSARLVSLIYSSDAVAPLEAGSLERLAEVSAQANRRNQITGYLSYREPRFTQYIEGPESEIHSLLGKLRADERHSVRTVAWLDISERRFEGWSMQLLDPLWFPTGNTLETIDELLGSASDAEMSDRRVAENLATLVEGLNQRGVG